MLCKEKEKNSGFLWGVLSQERSWCFTNYLYPVGLPEGKEVTIATLMSVQIYYCICTNIYMWKMLTSRHRHHWEAFTCMRRRRSSWMVHCTQPTCWCVRTPVSPTCPSPGRSIQVGAHSAWGTNVIYYSKLFISPQWTMSHVQVRCMHRPSSVTHRFNLTEACMVCKFSEARLWSFLNDFFF